MSFEQVLQNLQSSNPELARMAESTGSVPSTVLDQDLMDTLKETVHVDTSATGAFKKKYEETQSFTESAGQYMTKKFPESWASGYIVWRDQETGDFVMPHFKSANEVFGEDFSSLPEDERRQRIQEVRNDNIEAYYGDVAVEGSPLAAGTGVLMGYMTDPTTLAPVGTTYKAASAIGGGIAGADVAMEQLAIEGKVSAKDVAIAATFGAVLGPVVKYAGDNFMTIFRDKMARGEPFTPDEMLEVIPKAEIEAGNVNLNDLQKLSDAISARLDITPDNHLSYSVTRANELLSASQKQLTQDSVETGVFQARLAALDDVSPTKRTVSSISDVEDKFRKTFGSEGFIKAADAKLDVDKAIKDAIKPKTPVGPTPEVAEARAVQQANHRERVVSENFRSMSQRGEIATTILRDAGLATGGGLYGYASSGGDLEAAAMWAVGMGALPHAAGKFGPKLYNKVGKLNPYFKAVDEATADSWVRKYMAYSWTQRPSEYFKNVAGRTGEKFSNLLQRMDEDIRGALAENMVDVDSFLNARKITRGTADYEAVTDILRNPGKAKQYSKAAQEGAAMVRQKLNSIVKDAMGRGVISQKNGQKMLQDTVKKGYFPRVYDRHFLASKAGKAKWNEVLSKYSWTKEELKTAADSILGKDYDLKFDRFKAVKDKAGNIKYTVDNKFIADLYRNRAQATFSNRSTHLEKARKIKLPDEVLEPFLVNDIHDVLASYFHDTFKRINAAKYFGANDEGMHTIIKEMRDLGLTPKETDAAWEVFWTSVGDPKSNSIKQMVEMPENLRNIYSWASSAQTFKLIFAQTLNMSQATANSLIYLPSRAGVKSPKILLKGIGNTFKKQNREWAERIGAAAETTILEVAGEMGSLESRYATKFLKYTGFTAVEKLQRQLAANIGKAYVEEMLDTKAKLFAKSAQGRLSKAGKDQLKKINNQLLEIGINPDLSPNHIPVEQMNRAGQRFSNVVNFTNTPEKLPLAWQSPHAKIFRQFKTFMFHQGAFLHDNLLKPAKRGDLRPLLGLAAAGGLGMGPSEIRKWIKADDEEYTMTERYLQGFAAIGALGLLYDLGQQASEGPGRLFSTIAGPTAGDLATITEAVAKTGKQTLATATYEAADALNLYDLRRTAKEYGGREGLTADPALRALVSLPVTGQVLDASGALKEIGTLLGAEDYVEDLPNKQEAREMLKKKKSQGSSFYKDLYK